MTSASTQDNYLVNLPIPLKQQLQGQFERQYKCGSRISWKVFEQDWSRELSSAPPTPPSVRAAVYLSEIYSKARNHCEYRIADGLCLLLLKISYQKWMDKYRLSDNSPFPTSDRDPEPIKIAIANRPQTKTEQTDYIPRPTLENICYNTLTQPGALLQIKAPQERGKTALITQVLNQLETEGYLTVNLSLKLVDQQQFKHLDLFLKWLCFQVSQKLGLTIDFKQDWLEDILGSKSCCNNYFQQYLTQINQPLILCLDDVDLIFPHPTISNDFFPLLRFWHEQARSCSLWKKLRLAVIYSTEVYIPLNIHQSPFNVGVPVELTELTLGEVQQLVYQKKLNLKDPEIHQLSNLVGGHPYLINLALSYLKTHPHTTLKKLLETAPTSSGIYRNHLMKLFLNLMEKPEFKTALKQLITQRKPIQLETLTHHKLYSMGLVKSVGNKATISCLLYQLYFQNQQLGESL